MARAWNGLVSTAVHPDGFLGYVQNVGDRPESSQPVTYDSTANFGVGAFLLAGTKFARLAGSTTHRCPRHVRRGHRPVAVRAAR